MDIWIADSGGTKTDWLGLDRQKEPRHFKSEGLNPNVFGWRGIRLTLTGIARELMNLPMGRLFFFGAGLGIPTDRKHMAQLLTKHLAPQIDCQVKTDLEGSALAALGSQAGIVGILGTGAVAFRYNGKQVVERRGGLGYLLGDEGSACALGQNFLKHLLTHQLDPQIVKAHCKYFSSSIQLWQHKVYAASSPVAIFTSQIPFLSRYQEHPQIRHILQSQFQIFFQQTLGPLATSGQGPLVLLGGIAREFTHILRQSAAQRGLTFACPSQPPIWAMAHAVSASLGNPTSLNRAGIFDGALKTDPNPVGTRREAFPN